MAQLHTVDTTVEMASNNAQGENITSRLINREMEIIAGADVKYNAVMISQSHGNKEEKGLQLVVRS